MVEIDRNLELPGRSAAFWERVESYYQYETAIQGYRIYRRLDDRTV